MLNDEYGTERSEGPDQTFRPIPSASSHFGRRPKTVVIQHSAFLIQHSLLLLTPLLLRGLEQFHR